LLLQFFPGCGPASAGWQIIHQKKPA
jgi:hypothetical protein